MSTATIAESAVLDSLDFAPQIACESTFDGHDHDADALMILSCGCAPALCMPVIQRAKELSGEPRVYCPQCYQKRVVVADVRPLRGA